MNTVNLDAAVLSVGTLLQFALFVLLIRRRVFSQLPIFVVYNGYSLLAGFAALALTRFGLKAYFFQSMTTSILETSFSFLVLRELGKSVLRFNNIRAGSRWPVLLLFLINIAILWPAVQWQVSLDAYAFIWRFALRMFQVTTVLQAAAFGTLVGWSSLNKLRWPHREFRIATGMGIWTVVSLGALMLHSNGYIGGVYHWVDQLIPASTLFVLAWWVRYFWFEPPLVKKTQEAPVLEVQAAETTVEEVTIQNTASA